MSSAIRKCDSLHYGFLALPLAFAGIPLYIHAPDFYATQAGLPLASLGALLLLLRFIDAVQDPLIGRLSDAYAKHRLALMIAAALLLALSFAALFHPLTDKAPLVWFSLSMVLATSSYSVLSINLNSIGGLWSDDTHTKTRITGMREALGLLGLLIASALPSLLQQQYDKAQAFDYVSLSLAGLLALALLLFVPWYQRSKARFDRSLSDTPSQGFWSLCRSVPAVNRRFFMIYGISMLASSIPAVLILFFVRDRLGAEDLAGLFLGIYFISGAAAMPLWQVISKRQGKPQAWLASMLLAVASFIWAFFLGTGDLWSFGIICILSGIAFGAELALPPSMLADFIQAQRQQQSASLQFSFLTFLLKTAAALASLLVFGVLDYAGLETGAANEEQALLALSLAYALIPCVIKIAAALLLYRSLHIYFQGELTHETYQLNRSSSHA